MTVIDAFVNCARDQLGKPYQFATAGPRTFDCSGLVAFCWEQATGAVITRSSYEQISLGSPVAPGDTQPGDLAFWDTEHNRRAGHVGIVDFDRQMVISAFNEERGVTRTPLHGNYGGPFLGLRRLSDAGRTNPRHKRSRHKVRHGRRD